MYLTNSIISMLSLSGRLSYTDKYNRLKVVLDEESSAKLARNVPEANPTDLPVKLPSIHKTVPDDILALVGIDCDFEVRVRPYSFVSKLAHNRGQKIEGHNFTLSDIHPQKQYKN